MVKLELLSFPMLDFCMCACSVFIVMAAVFVQQIGKKHVFHKYYNVLYILKPIRNF